jgi:hypothetical protein
MLVEIPNWPLELSPTIKKSLFGGGVQETIAKSKNKKYSGLFFIWSKNGSKILLIGQLKILLDGKINFTKDGNNYIKIESFTFLFGISSENSLFLLKLFLFIKSLNVFISKC